MKKVCLGAALFAAGVATALAVSTQEKGPMASSVMRWEEGKATTGKWGEFRRYCLGETHTASGMFTGACVVKPGEALHAAHQHAEEEFLYLAEGSGRWHLDGKEIEAKKGDVIYAAPWVMHGLTNTGSTPLTFFVIKWNGKGVPVPEKPAK